MKYIQKARESIAKKYEGENKSMVKKVDLFLQKHIKEVACLVLISIVMTGTVYAGDAEALWGTLTDLIETWVTRLGAVVMFIGGVMFGLGWKSDDAEQKSRGVSTIIAGAIVTAVAALASQFFQ